MRNRARKQAEIPAVPSILRLLTRAVPHFSYKHHVERSFHWIFQGALFHLDFL
jgi:hypothetical protein